MARPIDATPTLSGNDAERLLRDIEMSCSQEEAQRRLALSRARLAKTLKPTSELVVKLRRSEHD